MPMTSLRLRNLRDHALIALLAGILLAGCGKQGADELLRSARDYQAKGDHAAAIIQLKNVVQQQPQNSEARLLLGQSHLASGDAESAEKEFRRALEYGQPAARVAPLLAQALTDSGQAEKVVAEYGSMKLDDPAAEAALRVAVGQAQLRLRKRDQAAASFAAALAVDPTNAAARLGQARLLASAGQLDEAQQLVDKVVAEHPQLADAHLLQGELRGARGDRAGARAAMEQAVAVDPRHVAARFELIALLIAERQFDAATAQVAAARAARGNDLRLVYFEALIASEQKDWAKARELAHDLLKRAPEHVPTLVLAGAVELHDKNMAIAEGYLQKAVALVPQHDGARKLLVRTYLGLNQPSRAVDVLQPLLGQGVRVDPSTMMLAGETYLANGDIKQAAQFFNNAAQSKPQEMAARVRLGQIALVSGDAERGIRELESAVASDAAPLHADRALIAGYLRNNEGTKALAAAQALVKKQPKDPSAQQILGAVHGALKDNAAARTAFERALALDQTYLPAVAALARLDVAEGKPAEARERFQAVVTREPNNDLALMGLADVMAVTKAPPAEIVPVLKRAIAARPQAVSARLALIRLYLQENDKRAALSAAQEAAAALRDDPRILDALGRAQLAAGETNQAIETYSKLATLQPQSAQPLLRLAAVYGSRKEMDKAIDVLLRAQKIAPTDATITRELVLGYLMQGKADLAIGQAEALQAATPKSAAGFVLEGDVYTAARQWVPAERSYRAALKAEPAAGTAAAKLHGVLLAANRKADADALARKWVAEHPADMGFRLYVAEQALRVRDYKSAAAHYQAVVAQQPDNVVALNNLAWTAGHLGDPKALTYAERALQRAPDSPLVLDTIGVLLVSGGDAAKGADYLARAVQLAPDRHDIRLNYAKALIKAGKGEQARKELTQLQDVPQEFAGKTEIAGLLKQAQ